MSFQHRGRLINPITVTIRQLDTASSGYDDTFRETSLAPSSDGLGTSERANKPDKNIPCQVEEKDFFEQLNAMMQGDSPNTRLLLTFHINDLKRLGMWQETATWGGRPALKKGDQIIGFKDPYNQQLFKSPENPGLYIEEVMPTGFLTTQNLVVCVIGDRSKGEMGVERGGGA